MNPWIVFAATGACFGLWVLALRVVACWHYACAQRERRRSLRGAPSAQ